MKRTLRILSVALVLGAAACGGETITAPQQQRSPAGAVHEGIGYLGGGGRSTRTAAQPGNLSLP